MKDKNFPACAESGWLTRTFEQNIPYDLDYSGQISPRNLKTAFLSIINKIENESALPKNHLLYLIYRLIEKRDESIIELAKPTGLSIKKMIEYLKNHFETTYHTAGAARLPVLAIYSIYQCFMSELKRFHNKKLSQLYKHTAADSRTGASGDIEVFNDDDTLFEAAEIKHGIIITPGLIKDAYNKFKIYPIRRYYLLSTSGIDESSMPAIEEEIEKILSAHGCQVIINGIYDSLKYYFRLLNNTDDFVKHYAKNLEEDTVIKFEHKDMWNNIVSI